jgi:cytochrome c peroxidase
MTGICAVLLGDIIYPVPLQMEVDSQKVKLGKKLFFDTALSKDNTVSCATCHNLQNGGDDGL